MKQLVSQLYGCIFIMFSVSSLQAFGIDINEERNRATVGGKMGEIQEGSSKIKVLVIPTDEELSIAQQTMQVLGKRVGSPSAS